MALVFAAQLDAEDALKFAKNLLVGDGFGLLVLVYNLLLFVDQLEEEDRERERKTGESRMH